MSTRTRVVDRPDVHSIGRVFVDVAAGAATGGVGAGASMSHLHWRISCLIKAPDLNLPKKKGLPQKEKWPKFFFYELFALVHDKPKFSTITSLSAIVDKDLEINQLLIRFGH
jgi:hypothetical protein